MDSSHKMKNRIANEGSAATAAPKSLQPKKALNTLLKFMEEQAVGKGASYITHTNMRDPKMSLQIAIEDLPRFMTLYKQCFNAKSITHCAIIEQHRHIGPIIIDFDFRQDACDHQYTFQHVQFIVTKLQHIISTLVLEQNNAECYVLTKPPRQDPKNPQVYKDGLHLVFPHVTTNVYLQYEIRKMFIAQYGSYFHTNIYSFANSAEDIYDESVIEKNGWMMYGSKKQDDIEPWLVQWIFSSIAIVEGDHGQKELTEEEKWDECFVDLLSIRNKYEESAYTDQGKSAMNANMEAAERKARLKAERSYADDGCTNKSFPMSSVSNNIRAPSILFYNQKDGVIEVVHKCIALLKPKRADQYNDWIRLGWCLHNIEPQSLLSAWIDFSRQSRKFTPGECERLWADMRNTGLQLGSLRLWAKEDAPTPEAYLDVYADYKKLNMLNSVSGTHTDIARVVHTMYKDTYVCTSIKPSKWYEYRDHRWHEVDNAYTLRQRISTEVFAEYMDLAIRYQQQAKDAKADEASKIIENIKMLLSIATKLKSASFKDQVMKECSELFFDQTFMKKLDENKMLIGFNNGIYDLVSMEFRMGMPEDYVTFTTGYDYESTPCQVIQGHIMAFITAIMPDQTNADYLLSVLAYMLSGNKYLELLWFFTGKGRNGKGTLFKLYSKVLGEYYYEPDISIVTTVKRNSSNPTPELAKAKGKRLLVASEPDDSDEQSKFRVNKLKQLRGNDLIQARGLYRDADEYVPQFGMIFQMNDIPELSKVDQAIASTLKIINFPFQFCDAPIFEHQRMVDTTLKDKFTTTEYAQQFFLIIVDYYQRFVRGNRSLQEPQEVTQVTEEYMQENNPVLQWFLDNVEVTNNPSDRVKPDELLYDYKAKTNVNNMSQTMFGKQMKTLGFVSKVKHGKRVYIGLKLKDYYDQEEEVDALG